MKLGGCRVYQEGCRVKFEGFKIEAWRLYSEECRLEAVGVLLGGTVGCSFEAVCWRVHYLFF